MNVVESGVLTILVSALLVAAAVLSVVVAIWLDQTASLSAGSLVPVRIGKSMLASQLDRPTPKDVLPANQAWRAPPTFLASPQWLRPGNRSRRC